MRRFMAQPPLERKVRRLAMEWKNDTGKYSCGELLFLGPWKVGGCHYDSTRNRDDPAKYAATCLLPGIKSVLGHFETREKAAEVAEKAVTHWLGKLPSNAQVVRRGAAGGASERTEG